MTNPSFRKKTKSLDLCLGSICLFPIATSIIPAGFSGFFTKVFFSAIVLSILLFKKRLNINRRVVIYFIPLIINYVYAIIETHLPLWNVNLFVYYPFFVIWMFFVLYNSEMIIQWFTYNESFVLLSIRTWCLITAFSALLPSSYYIKEGGIRYFGSITGAIYRLCPAAVLIQILILVSMYIYKRKNDIVLMSVPLFCFLMGSSRTYLLIGACIFAIAWYGFCKKKTYFYLSAFPVLLIGLWLASQSAIYDKVMFTLDDNQYGDFWFRITSSRSSFWMNDLKAWSKQNVFKKLVGCGLGFTYEVSGIWGHNDFIELLCSFGIVGLLEYIIVSITTFKGFFHSKKVPREIVALVFLTWFFNAFFNMHYTYFCCSLGFPLLMAIIKNYYVTALSSKVDGLCRQGYKLLHN